MCMYTILDYQETKHVHTHMHTHTHRQREIERERAINGETVPSYYTLKLEPLDGIGDSQNINISVQRDGEIISMHNIGEALPPKHLWNASILPGITPKMPSNHDNYGCLL